MTDYKKRQILQFLVKIKDEMKKLYIHHYRKSILIDYNLTLKYINRFDLTNFDVLSWMINDTKKLLCQQKLIRFVFSCFESVFFNLNLSWHSYRLTHVLRNQKQYEFNESQYRVIFLKNQAVYICFSRKLINATQLFKAVEYSRLIVASTIRKFEITIRKIIRESSAYFQKMYVNYDDYLRHFSFLKLNAIIISQLEERMKIESEMKNEKKETNEKKKETNVVTDRAENAENFLQLQLFIVIKLYSRTYNQNDCIFYSTLISEIVIYLCLAKRLVNASHLIKIAEYRWQTLKKKLEIYQISVA